MAGIFPFVQPQIYDADTILADPPLPLYKDVEVDFKADKPIFIRGNPKIVTGLPAVMGWAWRALHQERFLNEIYSWNYGNEIGALMGQQWERGTKEAEAARYVRECLIVSPYIKGIENVRTWFEGSTLYLVCNVITIYGAQKLEVDYGLRE